MGFSIREICLVLYGYSDVDHKLSIDFRLVNVRARGLIRLVESANWLLGR